MCKLVKIGDNVEVASIKEHTIRKIIDKANICNKIDAIILFGSSLEERCTEQSDIDMAFIINTSMSRLVSDGGYKKFKKYLYSIDENQEYDILYFRSLENIRSSKDFVCKDIISKGKTVYERR